MLSFFQVTCLFFVYFLYYYLVEISRHEICTHSVCPKCDQPRIWVLCLDSAVIYNPSIQNKEIWLINDPILTLKLVHRRIVREVDLFCRYNSFCAEELVSILPSLQVPKQSTKGSFTVSVCIVRQPAHLSFATLNHLSPILLDSSFIHHDVLIFFFVKS